jgi:hypothetical protein
MRYFTCLFICLFIVYAYFLIAETLFIYLVVVLLDQLTDISFSENLTQWS